jgi:hypothetical protein
VELPASHESTLKVPTRRPGRRDGGGAGYIRGGTTGNCECFRGEHTVTFESFGSGKRTHGTHHLTQQQLYLSILQTLLREEVAFGFVILVYDLGRAQELSCSVQKLRAVGCWRRRRRRCVLRRGARWWRAR